MTINEILRKSQIHTKIITARSVPRYSHNISKPQPIKKEEVLKVAKEMTRGISAGDKTVVTKYTIERIVDAAIAKAGDTQGAIKIVRDMFRGGKNGVRRSTQAKRGKEYSYLADQSPSNQIFS